MLPVLTTYTYFVYLFQGSHLFECILILRIYPKFGIYYSFVGRCLDNIFSRISLVKHLRVLIIWFMR
jgi:hypothetical protein